MSAIDPGPAWSAWSQVTPVIVGRASNAPYVRVELPLSIAPGTDGGFPDLRVVDANGTERPYALDPERPRAASSTPPAPPLERVVTESRERDDPVNHAQVWTFAPDVPVRAAAVTFSDGGVRYERSATVETSDDDAIWSWQGDGTIGRYANGVSQTLISVHETTARFVRVIVHDDDGVPVPSLQPALFVRPHAVVFAAGGIPMLLSGNPHAGAPNYDLGAQLARQPWTADDATTGPTVPNAGFRDSRPIAAWFLTAALLAVVLAGFAALRMVRPAAKAS